MNYIKEYLPKIFKKEIFQDFRGKLSHFNSLDLSKIKRVYFIENSDTQILRGWQYHQKESKIFIVIKGVIKIHTRTFVDQNFPFKNIFNEFILDEKDFDFLYVPPKNANLIQSLSEDSRLMVLSDFFLEESLLDKIRFDLDYFDSK